MKIGEMNGRYLFKKRIDFRDLVREDMDEVREDMDEPANDYLTDLSGSDDYVVMRELSSREFEGMSNIREEERIDYFQKLFPKCLVDHSFTADGDENRKAGCGEVAEELLKSGNLFARILTAWIASIPFQQTKRKDGG